MADALNLSRTAKVALAAGVGIALMASAATARGLFDRNPEDLSRGYVVAESRYGNGTVSGPIRHRRLGPQVRLPGGTWEWCRRSCSETLRVETIDFWDSRQDGIPQECGIFGCLDLRF
ncbi:MAG: hypothetical protein K0U74_02630 [Alphaproteobacteria bacterium]|nr:hypothetical protein [Alphaproteobacteria bacterium]